MSLILEALRKSEAERRRGSAPDVAMELPPVPAPRARATPSWLIPAALLAVAVLLAVWWWSQRESDAASEPTSVATSPAAETRDETPPQPAVVARPVPAPVVLPSTPVATVDTPPPVAAPAAPLPPPARAVPPPPAAPVDTRDVADIDATSLPPVKLSMHMWDESPSRRFVILDGQRMAEGDRSGEVTVVAIERDGVVVERNGQRARVPLP